MTWHNNKFNKNNVHSSYDFRRRRGLLDNEFVKFVFYSIIGAVIFLFVYSVWFEPGFAERSISTVQDTVGNVITSIEDKTSSGSGNSNNLIPVSNQIKQSSSVDSCLSEIKDKSRIAKEKSLVYLNINVREYREFSDSNSAIEYLDEWGYVLKETCRSDICFPNRLNTFYLPDFYQFESGSPGGVILKKYDNIVIALTKFEYSSGMEEVSMLQPVTCIDGELTENSIKTFI